MTRHAKPTRPKIDSKILRAFHQNLASWYQLHHRPLPWRLDPSPYHTVVSELMCQQTQIVTVLPYYERWLKRFPDWETLAQAPETDVLKHWEGLGYYRRARHLQNLARIVVRDFSGTLPQDVPSLLQLPGIGPYTAAAIASIAFGQKAALLDGNVQRVLTRVFAISSNLALGRTQKELQQLAAQLMPETHPGQHNQALMELGALLCSPRKPQCLLCPLQPICQAPDPEAFPVKDRPAPIRQLEKVCLILRDSRVWLSPTDAPGRWQGFHRLPLFDPARMELNTPLGQHRYSITKYRVQAEVWSASWKTTAPAGIWANLAQLRQIPLPAPHRKMLRLHPDFLAM
ncbi:MAG: A/G-specific adenine glycosylase [Blastochloris sp.]|nr:A/G-specific adenine glycosylase [Blastochloris sp.]